MSALRFFCQRHKKSGQAFTACSDVAAGEGFEPSHTESESLCYLYTIPLNARAIIHAFRDLSRIILGYLIVFCRPFLSLEEIVAHQHIHAGPVAF